MSENSVPVQAASSPSPVRRLGQVDGFNGMRGIAVLIVVVSHMEVILPIPTLLVIPGGTVSLDSFFVLSGFLITTLLLREQARYGRIGKLAFYRRRALRLLPALLVVVLATSLFASITNTWAKTEVDSILSVSFYYSNYYVAASPNALCANLAPGFQHMWSLSFEEQFYLVWPWITIALLTIRVRLRTVVIVLLALIAIVAIHRGLSYDGTGSWCSLFHRTDTRADSILWGALLAHIWIRGKEPKRGVRVAAWLAAGFLLICLPFADLTGPFLYRGGLVAIDAACAVLLLAILDGRWAGRRLFELKPFVALGVVSYGFYLWHLPVFYGVRYFDPHWNDVVRVVVALSVTLLLTIASWFLLEQPLMNWKVKLERKRDMGGT
jgi:peptidoglycan/LPS O-acetylase OafA/YrhL